MKTNIPGVLTLIISLFLGGLFSLPLKATHQTKYYPESNLITVEHGNEIINYLQCERIALSYPGLTDRCDVNIGKDSSGVIWAAITGTPTNTPEKLFKSKDGGLTWSSVEMTPTATNEFIAFTVLKNDSMLLATRPYNHTVSIHRSSDKGKTWQIVTNLEPDPFQYIGEGFLSMTQKKNGEVLFPICRYSDNPYETGVTGSLFISSDNGTSFPKLNETGQYRMESHILELHSGKLLMATRYQRTRNSTDTDESILALGGNIDPNHDFAFKHLFLADSDDGGATWKNFRPIKDKNGNFLIKYGQCHGQLIQLNDGRVVLLMDNRYESEERDVRARVSLDNGKTWEPEVYYISFGRGDPASVVLEDDTIVTVTGNWTYGPTGPVGSPTAQVVRWKLPSTSAAASIKVLSPKVGDMLSVGSQNTLYWSTTGGISSVKIELMSGTSVVSTITACLTNKSSYIWTIGNTISSGTNYKIRISDCSNPKVYGDSAVFSIAQPFLTVSPKQLVFGAVPGIVTTSSQDIVIKNSGTGILNWSVLENTSWLSCSATSGIGDGTLSVSVDPSGLSVGTYTAEIIITASNAGGSPVTIGVTLNIYNVGDTPPIIGSMDTPLQNSKVEGSVPFTGWALDCIGINSVKLYYEKGEELIYVGDCTFVQGARPDVEALYGEYPRSNMAGWGYMMLTNYLEAGTGTYTFYAIATNLEGEEIVLGTRVITIDNENATYPFGTIDTPEQGNTVSGKGYYNFGWVLTPQGKEIDKSGKTIDVYIDGKWQNHPVYNEYRKDIAELFPGYANSNGAVGYLKLDTTKFENGVHTIYWAARDSGNVTGGIGSRFFTIQNPKNSNVIKTMTNLSNFNLSEIDKIPLSSSSSLKIIRDRNNRDEFSNIVTVAQEQIEFELKESERVEMHFGSKATNVMGYMKTSNGYATLPIGSTITDDVFYWIPPPGFIGEYPLLFIIKDGYGKISRKDVIIKITPKFQ